MKLSIIAAGVLGFGALTMTLSAQAPSSKQPMAIKSFYDLKTKTLDGKPADLGDAPRQGQPRRERREQVRLHAAVRRPREAAARDEGQGFNVLGFPSNDFGGQEPGTPEEIADVLQADLRRDVPDVREGRDQDRRATSRRSTRSSGSRATCRPGTSASTSSTRTARSSRSSRAR